MTPPRRLATALAAATVLLATAAHAGAVCTAAQIMSQEAGCPAAGTTCTINGQYEVKGALPTDACTLDFGARAVTLAGRLTIGTGAATIRATSFSISGLIDGIGSGTNEIGGMLQVQTSGKTETLLGGRIDVSGKSAGGTVLIRAGGPVSILGKIQADNIADTSAGGLIDISAGSDITLGANGVLSAVGGNDSNGGGEIDLTAGGNITLNSDLEIGGFDGGFAELNARGSIQMLGIDASANGDAGSGGCINVTAGHELQVLGAIVSDGATGTFMTGGCGGIVCLEADFGAITVGPTALVSVNGARPDGGGGELGLAASGSTTVNGQLQARGPIGETCGGDVCIDAGLDVSIATGAEIDASGGDSGGGIELLVGRNATINGPLDASGRQAGSLGGDITVRAGERGSGALGITSLVDVSTLASCTPANGCGEAGTVDLMGCNVTLSPTSSVIASGPQGGDTLLTARELLTAQGPIDASRTTATGKAGHHRLVYPARRPPVLTGSILPAPTAVAVSTCPTEGPTNPTCLVPCPVCGNGMVEFPETCDRGQMPPLSCNGCSLLCQTEDCDDHLACTTDSCTPTLGCLNQQVAPPCTEPPATATGTPPTTTPTSTPTASPTLTSTFTTTPTPTQTVSATVSPTPTPPSTNTPLDTAATTPTDTATATPPSTSTPVATATDTAAPSTCTGDCSGDGTVAVNELVTGVNIALGNAAASVCPAFDTNRNGAVSINELIAAVNAALTGC